MYKTLALVFIIFFFPQQLNPPWSRPLLLVWNVGQGQWVTWKTQNLCLHFDMGGEWAPWRQIQQTCQGKTQQLILSHFDKDHTKFIRTFKSQHTNLCYLLMPHEPPAFFNLPPCPIEPSIDWQLLFRPTTELLVLQAKKHRSNSRSLIVSLLGKFLFPGDSPQEMEKYWATRVHSPIRWLLLGHHGSRTSTSPELLRQLPQLRQAVASLRHGKYGHPHFEVVKRLKKFRVSLITTEDWGTIALELN